LHEEEHGTLDGGAVGFQQCHQANGLQEVPEIIQECAFSEPIHPIDQWLAIPEARYPGIVAQGHLPKQPRCIVIRQKSTRFSRIASSKTTSPGVLQRRQTMKPYNTLALSGIQLGNTLEGR
jgi:hypothetical protein